MIGRYPAPACVAQRGTLQQALDAAVEHPAPPMTIAEGTAMVQSAYGRRRGIPAMAKKESPSAARTDGVVRKQYKDRLPVKVNEERVDELGRELAQLHREAEVIKDRRRESMAKFKEKLSGIVDRMNEIATGIEASTEIRDVEVVERLIVETNEVLTVRLDTGEILARRTATAEDRQESLTSDAKPARKRGRKPKAVEE